MIYSIIAVPKFKSALKKLLKKYPSLKNDFLIFIESLESNPQQGTSIGKNCFKIRLQIKSKNKGKSGGARIITNIVISESIVYLLSIYDKTDKNSLTNKELEELLRDIPE